MSSLGAAEVIFPFVSAHQNAISSNISHSLAKEDAFEQSGSFEKGFPLAESLRHQLSIENNNLVGFPNTLFTRLYADSYIGLRQAVQIDSITAAIQKCEQIGALSGDQVRWMTIALGRSILKCATTTGHFAQFLSYKEVSHRRFVSQRRRNIWAEFLLSVDMLSSVNHDGWRSRNKVFNEDSLLLLPRLKKLQVRPSVVYADPPYTDDQYSRFYHLLETLVLYDNPQVTGKARYRTNRFQTSFSLKTSVLNAFHQLIKGVREIGADLVLSYPSNGLLREAGGDPLAILKTYFSKAECRVSMQHTHSTLGGSKGSATEPVTEFLYLARA